jgi:hypothetical protein
LCPVHHAKYDSNHKTYQRLVYRVKVKESVKSFKGEPTEESNQFLVEFKNDIKEVFGYKLSLTECRQLMDMAVFHLSKQVNK